MPNFADLEGLDDQAPDRSALINVTPEDTQAAARATGGNQYGFLSTLAGDAIGGAVDLVDTVASSIPGLSHAAGIKRGTINEGALRLAGMPGFTNFYNQNQGGIEIASSIYGVIAADMVARRVAGPLGKFLGGIKGAPILGSLVSLDAKYAEAMNTVRLVDTQLARSGVTGAEAWSREVQVRTGVVGNLGPEVGSIFTTTRRAVANKASLFGFAKGAGSAALTEGVMATFLNQNNTLYSEDVGQNLMWMGLGVATGGVFNALGAGYQMRKFANSDTLNRIKAGALDPTGLERAMNDVPDLNTSNATFLGTLQGTKTDTVTALMTTAKAQLPVGVDSSSFKAMATQHEKLAMEELTKVTVKGLPNVRGTGFSDGSNGYWNHVQGALHKDPGLMYGTEMIGGIADEMTIAGTHGEITEKMKSRIEDLQTAFDDHVSGTKLMTEKQHGAAMKEMKQLRFQEGLSPMVLMDQELMPLSEGSIYDNWAEPNVRTSQTEGENQIWEAFNPADNFKGFNVGIESDGTLHLPNVKGAVGTLDNADHFDAMRLYRSAQHMISDMAAKVADPEFAFTLPFTMENGRAKFNWFHLDMAQELLDRTGGRAKINWGTLTPELAQKESLIQKAKALRAKGFEDMTPGEVQKMRLRYNLPRLNSYEMGVMGTDAAPTDGLLRGMATMTDEQLKGMSLSELKQAGAEMSNVGDFTRKTGDDMKSLSGNSFRFLLDDSGMPVKPILMYKRNIAPMDFSPDILAERIGVKKLQQAQQLLGPQTGPMTRAISEAIYGSPDYQLGTNVLGLTDTQLTSSIPGLQNIAPQSAVGSALNSVVTQEFRARDTPAILAITRLRESVDRQMLGFMRETVQAAFGDSLTVLNGPRNGASKALLDNFHTFRAGWDLESDTIKLTSTGQNDLNGFVLADTQGNKARWKQRFNQEMPSGQTLVDSKGKEVALDDMSLDVQKRYNAVTDALRIEKNSLLNTHGLPEIRRTEWYVAPPELKGKYIGYTFDSTGAIVPGGTVVAPTQQAFEREVARLKADPDSVISKVPGAQFRTRDEISDFATIWDKAQMDMVDPGTTAIQGDKSAKGFLTPGYINTGRFDDAMRNIRDSFISHGSDVMETLTDDQIKAVQSRANIAGGATRNADSKQGAYRSIYDYWLMAAKGQSQISGSPSIVGGVFNAIENKADDILRQAAPKANEVWQVATDWVTKRMPWSEDARSVKRFTALTEALGEHMPFESAAEMIERQSAGASPFKLKDITGAGNQFTATWMLRMLEPAQAIMNLSGIINAMPAVIRNISPKAGESTAELAARLGHSASIFTSEEGRSFTAIDMGKLAYKGFKRAWSRASDVDYEHMMKNGFLSQEVAEFQRQFNTVQDAGSFKRFMSGDANATTAFGKKGLVGWMSILTDKSEDFSRSWGHMIGLEAAELAGVADRDAAHNFAHDIANKMIANYSPLNRPEIFQGAVGAPIGLFQSFMWAYYQRMFRYVETGDKASIGIQAALQGSLYGVPSVPGFSELNSLFFQHDDGKSSPYDALYAKFGPAMGDMLMAGTLSNLPKLFGAPGVSIYTRGDVSPRIVTQNPITNSAPVAMISKIMQAVADGVHVFSRQNPNLDEQQVGEVFANMMPNRPLSGMIEQVFANGFSTDASGQVKTDTTSRMESVYRMIGLRSLDQSKQLEAYYSNKQAMQISAAKQGQFRELLRGAIRGGNEADVPDFIAKYLADGGDPRQVKRLISDAYRTATTPKATLQLTTALRSPSKMAEAKRLMDMGVSITDTKNTDTSVLDTPDPLNNEQPTATENSDSMAYGIPEQ